MAINKSKALGGRIAVEGLEAMLNLLNLSCSRKHQ